MIRVDQPRIVAFRLTSHNLIRRLGPRSVVSAAAACGVLGDMWNSNSVIAWLLTRAGINARDMQSPQGGRAPGWMTVVLEAELNRNKRFSRTTPRSSGGLSEATRS